MSKTIEFGAEPPPFEYEELTPIKRQIALSVTNGADYRDSSFNRWTNEKEIAIVEDETDVAFGLWDMSYRQARLLGDQSLIRDIASDWDALDKSKKRSVSLHITNDYITNQEQVSAMLHKVNFGFGFSTKQMNFELMNELRMLGREISGPPTRDSVFDNQDYWSRDRLYLRTADALPRHQMAFLDALINTESSDVFVRRYLRSCVGEAISTSHPN